MALPKRNIYFLSACKLYSKQDLVTMIQRKFMVNYEMFYDFMMKVAQDYKEW